MFPVPLFWLHLNGPYSSRLSKDLDTFTAEEWFVDLQLSASGSCFWVVDLVGGEVMEDVVVDG